MTQMHNTQAYYHSKRPIDASDERSTPESTLWKLALLAAIAYLVWSDRPLVVFKIGRAHV